MEIKEIEDKKIWEEFLAQCRRKTFLQSWSWGDFHHSLGNKVWRFGVSHEGQIIAAALVIKISAKRGSFLLVPHGPAVEKETHDAKLAVLKALQEKLIKLAKIEKADFIRVSPIMARTEEDKGLFKQLGFRQGPLHYHPESSWKLDITPTEDQLMAGMRKSTRYLIRQAEKNPDIEIIKSTNVEDMQRFYDIHTPVAKMQKFVPFSLDYLKKEFSAFLPDNNIALYFAKYQGEYIAASFQIFYSSIGFYHHAALLPQFHKIPVSALLQWEAIKESKRRGGNTYDFWGYADPVENPKHPYSGPTLFKMGFGGYVDEYVKTQDYVISPKYWINYIIESARKIKRGL